MTLWLAPVVKGSPTMEAVRIDCREDLLLWGRYAASALTKVRPVLLGLVGADAADPVKIEDAITREATDITNGLWGRTLPAYHRSSVGELMLWETPGTTEGVV